jgi:hypothetical protein
MVYSCQVDPNDINGRYICTFENVWLNCSLDSDCPGDAMCYKGNKWSALPAQCACNMMYGRTGDNCDVLGVAATGVVLFNVIAMLVFLVALFLNLWVACIIARRTITALHGTVLLCSCSCIAGIAKLSIYFVQLSGSEPMQVLSDGSKKLPLLDGGNLAMAFSFVFTCVGVLNVSVTWVHVAEKVRTNSSTIANTYRRVIYMFFAFFCIVVVVLLALNKNQYVEYVCIPAIIYFAIAFLIGYIRLRKHMKRSLALSPNESKKQHDRMVKVFTTISRTALLASIQSYLLIFSMVISIGLGVDGDNPKFATTATFFRLAYVFTAFLILQVSFYTFQFARSTGDLSIKPSGDGQSTQEQKNTHMSASKERVKDNNKKVNSSTDTNTAVAPSMVSGDCS